MLTATAAVIGGFILLAWSADKFVDGAASIARHLHVSPMVIGLTIVSLCTSFPEMAVSALAAIDGNADIAIGNALGSNIANIGLVLGFTALMTPLTVHSLTLRREFPVLFMVFLLALALMLDGELDRMDGAILVAGLVAMLWWLTMIGMNDRRDPLAVEYSKEIPADMTMASSVGWFVAGLLLMLASSRVVVWGAVEIAHHLGISDLVIGLTIVAVGTSLPELMASVASVKKREYDLAIGNVVGSNMFNILAVLSMPALFAPQPFAAEALTRDFPVMAGFSIALYLMARGFRTQGKLGRIDGAILFAGFVAYVILLYLQS